MSDLEYLLGIDLVGGVDLVGAPGGEGVLVIRVLNVGDLARAKGGAAGAAAYGLAPGTVTAKALDEMAKQFAAKMREQGVVADVRVASQAPTGPPPRGEFLPGVLVGAGAAGALGALGLLVRYFLKRRMS